MRRLLIASLALIACGGAAPASESNSVDPKSDEGRMARALKGLVPGKPVNCISQFRPSYSTQIVGDTILYRVNNRLVYRNETSGGCNATPGSDALIVRNFGSQLCRGNIVRTFHPLSGFETGGCSLGTFTPYTKAK